MPVANGRVGRERAGRAIKDAEEGERKSSTTANLVGGSVRVIMWASTWMHVSAARKGCEIGLEGRDLRGRADE